MLKKKIVKKPKIIPKRTASTIEVFFDFLKRNPLPKTNKIINKYEQQVK